MVRPSQVVYLVAYVLVIGGWPPLTRTSLDSAIQGSHKDLDDRLARGGDQAAFIFRDVTRQSGIDFEHMTSPTPEKYMPETMGSGIVLFDFNNDGYVDVFLVNSGSLLGRDSAARMQSKLFKNNGNGTFTDVTSKSGIVLHSYGMGGCAADYDNDGWDDLYITGFAGNALFHNNGDGTFTDVTTKAGVALSSWSTSCAFGDVDNDGYVDLFVVNYVDFGMENNKYCGDYARGIRAYCHPNVYNGLSDKLYRNNGNGTFSDISRSSGIENTRGKGLGVVFGDYNNDGWLDIFVANDSVPNFLFENQHDRTFREVALWAGVAVDGNGRPGAGMGTDMADYDNDGWLDIFITHLDLEAHTLYHNDHGVFAESYKSGIGRATLPFVGFGATFLDYDNDGLLDLAVANGNVLDNAGHFREGATYRQRKLLFHNEGNGAFREIGQSAGPALAREMVGRGVATADFDNDGYLDLMVTNNGAEPELLHNEINNPNKAVIIRTVGTRSNRDGIGARLMLTVGSNTQIREIKAGSSYLSQSDLRPHFGLRLASQVDRLEIRWPSGIVDAVIGLPANHIFTVVEGKGVTREESLHNRAFTH
jgi:enediyne biosynthesis protein E4